jgi:hypothetical protein
MPTRQKATDKIALLQGTLDLPVRTTTGVRISTSVMKQGRQQLVIETKQWRRLAPAIAGILGGEEV